MDHQPQALHARHGPHEDWRGIAGQIREEGYENVDSFLRDITARQEIDVVCRAQARESEPSA
jgi:hypothetical protein